MTEILIAAAWRHYEDYARKMYTEAERALSAVDPDAAARGYNNINPHHVPRRYNGLMFAGSVVPPATWQCAYCGGIRSAPERCSGCGASRHQR